MSPLKRTFFRCQDEHTIKVECQSELMPSISFFFNVNENNHQGINIYNYHFIATKEKRKRKLI
jgi:hypothetical protein